jgi:3-dehydroquinate dehydratase-2
MPKPIYVLSGPNLNLLGSREPEIYGYATLADIETACRARAAALGHTLVFRQSNHEGVLIDWIQECRTEGCALILNPAGYGHTSIALLDALKTLSVPIVECHLSNPAAREDFRRQTYVAYAATGLVSGFGAKSYELALEAVVGLLASATA